MVINQTVPNWTRNIGIGCNFVILFILRIHSFVTQKIRDRAMENLFLEVSHSRLLVDLTQYFFMFCREKKWVNVGPSSCTLKVFKWVPGIEHYFIFVICQTVYKYTCPPHAYHFEMF